MEYNIIFWYHFLLVSQHRCGCSESTGIMTWLLNVYCDRITAFTKKKKRGGGVGAVVRIVHQSKTLKEKCQPSPFRYDSEQWLMGLSDIKSWSRRKRRCFFRAARKHAGAYQDQNQCLQHHRQDISPKYCPLLTLLRAVTFFLHHPS